MYLTFNQVILISDKSKVQPDDTVVYVKETSTGRIFYPDFVFEPDTFADWQKKLSSQRYGILYLDANEQWCVVPDVWSEDDARFAKSWI